VAAAATPTPTTIASVETGAIIRESGYRVYAERERMQAGEREGMCGRGV